MWLKTARGNLHRPKRYHRGLRRVFYLAALSAIKPDGPSRAFYHRKPAEGKLRTQAVIALARRLIDVRLRWSSSVAPRRMAAAPSGYRPVRRLRRPLSGTGLPAPGTRSRHRWQR